MKKNTYLLTLPALAIVVLDQISKYVVVRSIGLHESIPLISGFFNLVHTRNRGMAFGLMNRPGSDFSFYFLVAATFAAVILLLFWFTKLKDEERRLIFGISLILGGAVGNLIDRLRLREVIDFLDFHVGTYHWPAFNLADSAITLGTFWVAINLLFYSPKSSKVVK
ncbi:MAG: signal peptidase II [Nitrospira bacterium SG8_3]|nr:MAG: signal peptidase II [Nitrospira bacterium SG8_3]